MNPIRPPESPMDCIENRTFAELKVGETASLARTLTFKDIELFAIMSGDMSIPLTSSSHIRLALTTFKYSGAAINRLKRIQKALVETVPSQFDISASSRRLAPVRTHCYA